MKDTAFETSATAFLTKERVLQGRIEELEPRLGKYEVGPGVNHGNEVNEVCGYVTL